MRKQYLWLLILVGWVTTAMTQVPSDIRGLSENSSVSVLTCAPGQELYSVFGHSAIRISDPDRGIDLAFNFGTFDFNTSFFYLKFGHGTLDYILSVSHFRQFMQEYFISGRSVWEQTLGLTLREKNALFRALMENARPQNRAYRYDFFFDNCATRVRDGVLAPLDSPLNRVNTSVNPPVTLRQALHPFLEQKPWTRLGIDMILGTPADSSANLWSLMFLPRHLMSGFSTLKMETPSGLRPLVSETTQLLEFNDTHSAGSGISPAIVLWLLAMVVLFLSLAQFYGVVRPSWLNPLLFLVVGVAGLIIGYLCFVSRHVATGHNWNFLWANPLWFFFVTNVNNWWRRFIGWFLLGALLFLLFFFWSLPQQFPLELIPLWLMLIARLTLRLLKK